jgi:hypothetical protein|tara:strand:+ start:84 stop:743 length:660 start_codon:yes stop_codon:yes gene_type:complete
MNIFNPTNPPPQHDPSKLLQEAERLLNKTERKQGWPYYDIKHAVQFAQMVVKLSKIPSKKATINTLTLRQQPQTVRARLSQGKAFIVDKGIGVLRGQIHEDDMPLVSELSEKVQISVRKVNLIIELVEPIDNILDAMVPLMGGTDEDPFVFNEDVFRDQVVEFINSGEIGAQASWQNYTTSAEKYARQLAMQDNTIIIETTPTELIIMKMSEEMLKGLE